MSYQEAIYHLRDHVSKNIIGQDDLIERIIIAILCDGHLLVEGAPGLAKTRAIKVVSESLEGAFHRIQFTPDLLPADITGTEIFRPQDGSFSFQKGPLFHNIILADEINRAPAKVQSALLEAMGERQITVAAHTYDLPDLFLVMATQNPIEQEGTYPLPEAQLDRFLMHVYIDYPDAKHEKSIIELVRNETLAKSKTPEEQTTLVSQDDIFAARDAVLNVFMADNLQEYLVQLVLATRNPERYQSSLANWIQYGASPRASIALDRCSRAHAWLNNRDFVGPEDIQAMAYDVLRHRIILSFEAEAEGINADKFINELINVVPVP